MQPETNPQPLDQQPAQTPPSHPTQPSVSETSAKPGKSVWWFVALSILLLADVYAAGTITYLMLIGGPSSGGVIVVFPIVFMIIFSVLITVTVLLSLKLPVYGIFLLAALVVTPPFIKNEAYQYSERIQLEKSSQTMVVDIPVYTFEEIPSGYEMKGRDKWSARTTKLEPSDPKYVKVASATFDRIGPSNDLFVLSEWSGAGHNPPSACNFDPISNASSNPPKPLPKCEQIGSMPDGEPIYHYLDKRGEIARDYFMTRVKQTNISLMAYIQYPSNYNPASSRQYDGYEDAVEAQYLGYVQMLHTLRTTPEPTESL
jgi:hypothetical protein